VRLEWVNHASFVLAHDGVRLISDPWIDGFAFNHGWKHLVPTEFGYGDFGSITHIWLSHEHPDHFSPRNLLQIPEEARSRITMLFQEGVDHRIGTFCRNAGFKQIHELRSGEWLTLAGDLRVRSEDAGSGDTWLCVRTADQTLLNINDAYLAYRWRLDRIKAAVGAPIDILLTQFSYANWVGNPDERELRRAKAEENLRLMGLQIEVLQPRQVIPFASMVWFCHEENFYLNDEMNSVEDAYRYLSRQTTAEVVVMFPGETWNIGEPHDSEATLAKYRPYYAALEQQPELVTSPSVDIGELQRLAGRFFKLLSRNNPRAALWAARTLRLLRPARIWLWDYQRSFELSPAGGLQRIGVEEHECDVAMGSDSLAYALRYLWGGGTLHVNGRFRVPPDGDFRRFARFILIASYNSRGWSMLRNIPVLLTRFRHPIQPRARGHGSQRALG
jgi:L-ascorbate metabolism protein UlaG (beta-lactamase superfamily)